MKNVILFPTVLFAILSLTFSQKLLAQNSGSPRAPKPGVTSPKNDDAPESSVSSEFKVDTSNTTDFNLDANFETRTKSHYLLGYETTHSPPSAGQTISIDTSELRLGAGADYGDDFSFTINYALWGAVDQISTNTFGVDLKWLGDNWIFDANPQIRFIAVPINDDSALKKTLGDSSPKNVNISDPSIAATLNFIGWDPWHFKGKLAYYSYNRDLETVFSSSLSRFFSSSAINSANNFNEFEASIEVGYAFKYITVAFEYLYAISALDYSVNPSYTGKTTYTFIKDFEIELDGGQTPGIGTGSPNVDFINLGLTKYW